MKLMMVVLGVMPALVSPGAVAPERADLTFEQRVAAQAAIERVYWSHQDGAARPFEVAVPRELLEEKVRNYLRQSVALETRWNTAITAEMFEAELARIAERTRMPGRLGELFAALGHNRLLIQECLVRPTLADRLARTRFTFDVGIHAAAREEATRLRTSVMAGVDPGSSPLFRRTETERVLGDGPRQLPERDPQDLLDFPVLADRFAELRASAAGWPNGVEPIVDGPDELSFRVLVDAGSDRVRVVTYSVPKRSFSSWLAEQASSLDRPIVIPVPRGPLPVPSASFVTGCVADDTWYGSFEADDAPSDRYKHTSVWTGSEMIVWGGDGPSGPFQSGGRYDPALDRWRPTRETNAPEARFAHTAVWSGERMVVFGGESSGGPLASGGVYDPVTDTWTETAFAGAPEARTSHSAVWTGSRMIVWGGLGTTPLGSGAVYDPAMNAWLPTSLVGAPSSRYLHFAIWTGSEMLISGGVDSGGYTSTGARYDPATDTWSAMASSNLGVNAFAVWTGSHVIAASFGTYAQYDPVADAWSMPQNMPTAFGSAIWTGSRVLFWGGQDDARHQSGAFYDPADDSWEEMNIDGAPMSRSGHTALWTGDEMIVWGGTVRSLFSPQSSRSGGRFHPATGTWSPTRLGPFGGQGSIVWTGSYLLAWGGIVSGLERSGTGERYDPATDSWSPISAVGAPSPRAWHRTVWTGSEMIVWGGDGPGDGPFDDGARYDPLLDHWTPMSATGAPEARWVHHAVWTGSRMIIWGGIADFSPPFLTSGAIYDPSTDTWTPMTMTGAPEGRALASLVWTGDRAVVWGGQANTGGGYLQTGASYDPEFDQWSPTTLAGAPIARTLHSAVWDGTKMIVWGGDRFGELGDGASYDVGDDTWSAMAMTNAPLARSSHGAVWTGAEMVIWGGFNADSALASGARYRPDIDSWTPMSSSGPRASSTLFWNGGSVLAVASTSAFYALGQDTDHDGDGMSTCEGDCNDLDPAIHPGAPERCNGIDDDCDGVVPPAEVDQDFDGTSACQGDCDDSDPSVYPGARETCDQVDEDCDGAIDEDFDADGDGYTTCHLPTNDCDDTDAKGRTNKLRDRPQRLIMGDYVNLVPPPANPRVTPILALNPGSQPHRASDVSLPRTSAA